MTNAKWRPTSSEDLETLIHDLRTTITIIDHDFVVLNQYNALTSTPLLLLVGQPFLDSIPDNRKPVIQSILNRTVSTGETQTFEVKYDNFNSDASQPLWYRHEVKRLTFQDGRSVISIYSTDVSLDKNNEAQSNFLSRLLNSIDGAVLIYDFETNTTTFANYYMEEMTGIKVDNTGEFTMLGLYHPDEQAKIRDYGNNTLVHLEDGESSTYEARIRHRDGHWMWVHVRDVVLSRYPDGRVKEILGIIVDLSEKKEIEGKLALSDLRFRTIFENTPDGITITRQINDNFQDSRYVALNPNVSRIYGYSREEILSPTWSWKQLLPADEIPKVYERFDNPELHKYTERRFIRGDGTEAWAESWMTMIPNVNPDNPDEYEVINIFHDISEHKRLEAKLRLNQRRFRAIFENASDGIGISQRSYDDFDHYKIIDINPMLCKILGYTKEEIMARIGMDFLPEEEKEKVKLRYQNPEANKLAERRIIRKDGTEAWVESMMITIPDTVTNTYEIITFSRNITERKQLERELRLSQKRFHAIFENTPDGITITRRHKDNYAEESRFIDINPAVSKIYGLTRDEILHPNWSWKKMLPPEEIEKVYRRFENPEGYRLVEHRVIKPDGSEAWIEALMTIVPDISPDNPDEHEIINIFRDITARKHREHELFEASQRFKSLADNLPAIVILIDTEERYLYVNKFVADRVGIPQEDFVGLEITDIIKIPEQLQQWRDQIARVIKTQAPDTMEYTFTYKVGNSYGDREGQVGHNLSTIIPLFDEDGNITSFLSHSVELSEMYQREEELRQAKALAERAIRTRDHFLANISHELRSPIHVILGFAELLNGTESLLGKSYDYLNTIISNGQHLTRLINDLLDASQLELGQFDLNVATVNLHQLIRNIAQAQTEVAQAKGIKLITDIESDVPIWIEADATRFRQIVVNLLTNAIKFTDQGYVELSLAVVNDPQTLILEVKDTGSGIPKHLQDKIFEAFVTDKHPNKSSGVGLGLYITHSLVQLMGGAIRIESQKDNGSIFRVMIPLTVPATSGITLSNELLIPIKIVDQDIKYRVLVIDDMVANASLMAIRCIRWGFEVETLLSSNNAFEYIQEWQPHIILLDLYLPEISGFALAEKIREEPSLDNTVIIAVTASGIIDHQKRALALGCERVVTKPVDFNLLAELISELIDIEFEYGVAKAETSPGNFANPQRSLPNFYLLPFDWLRRMYTASVSILPDDVLRLLDEIEETYPDIANTIQEMLDTFRIDQIADTISEVLDNIDKPAE